MKWPECVFHWVDWESHSLAFHRLPWHHRIYTAKLIHNLANTNRQKRLYHGTPPLCPGCVQVEDTFEHVLTCPFPSMHAHQDAGLKQLETALTSILPSPLLRMIFHGFSNWLQPTTSGHTGPLTSGSITGINMILTVAYTEQFTSIGWFKFTLGRVSKKWASAVQLLNRTQVEHINPMHTISLMINHIWQFLAAMWNHRNTIVHGVTVEEQTSHVINTLQDQLCHHYQQFHEDSTYVLTRHH
jgi:hypothetical protein